MVIASALSILDKKLKVIVATKTTTRGGELQWS